MDKKDIDKLFTLISRGFFSFFIFQFVFVFLGNSDISGAILAATITLSIVIYSCTDKILNKDN